MAHTRAQGLWGAPAGAGRRGHFFDFSHRAGASVRSLAALALVASLAALGGCGGGDSSSGSSSETGTGTGTGSTGTGTGTGSSGTGSSGTDTGTGSTGNTGTGSSTDTGSTSAEQWTLATGANAADLADLSAALPLSVRLDTRVVSSSASRLTVSSSGGTSTVALDGVVVATVSSDALGLNIVSTAPAGTLLNWVLEGSSSQTVTVLSAQPYQLTLAGVSIASTDGPALNLQSKVRAFVTLAEGSTNTLTDTSSYSARTLADGSAMDLKATLFAEGPLIFGGRGALSITAASKHALASDRHLRLRSGTLTLASQKKDGIRVNQAFVMDGGTLKIETASGAGKGIKVDGLEDASATPLGFVAINAGVLTINSYDKAITAAWESDEDGSTATLADDPDPRVTINGGTLTISTFGAPYEDRNLADGDSSLSPEGIEAKSVLTINGGTLLVTTTDDALNAGTAIVINGGRIYAKASANDAIDSNGTLTINGGVVVADGASGAEGGLDCDQNTFSVTGGTFIGLGGRNSTVTRSASTQNTVSLRNLSAGLWVLRDDAGQAVWAFTMPRTASAVVLSAPGIAAGSRYSVVQGGSLAGGAVEAFQGLWLGSQAHTGGTVSSSFTVSSTVTGL